MQQIVHDLQREKHKLHHTQATHSWKVSEREKGLKKKAKSQGFHMGVSENSGTPKSSILIGFSIINHPFWGTHMFGNTHIFGIYPRVANKGLDCDPRNLFLMFHFMSVTSQHPGGSYLSWWFFPTHLQQNRFNTNWIRDPEMVKIENVWKKRRSTCLWIKSLDRKFAWKNAKTRPNPSSPQKATNQMESWNYHQPIQKMWANMRNYRKIWEKKLHSLG